MKSFFAALIILVSLGGSANAQGFVGVSVASIQAKARPDSVELYEGGKYGVCYYVERMDSVHVALYHVTSFDKTGVCTSYEYEAPVAEQVTLTEWLNRFYIRKTKNTWRSHNGIVLTLTVEGDKVWISEEKPVVPTRKN